MHDGFFGAPPKLAADQRGRWSTHRYPKGGHFLSLVGPASFVEYFE
ncbi:hypothetical protein DOT_4689 [Desulfosporosinus sp. OT]|nr:hypothetical protein DOT_4689 [Desulfosporosinus sp. OT]